MRENDVLGEAGDAIAEAGHDTGLMALIRRIRRFIDFDGTIVDDERTPRSHLCGVPVGEFFAQAPYVIATWNRPAAIAHFARFPLLPQPEVIISPPMIYLPDRGDIAKDFEALGVTGALIVDDFGPKGLIHAPGCRIIGPDDPL